MIEVATYRMLVKWSDVKIFAVIILKIDRLIFTVENKSEEVNLHELSHIETLEQIKVKFLFEYHDYLDIFNQVMINQLSSYHFYDHKIELINEETFSRSRLYQMFNYKLQKIKKYLINHLNKEFIFFSFASYVSLILFIKKKDESLRFCIDYRKLNALIRLIASGRVGIFLEKCRVGLRSWTRALGSGWEAWSDNSTRKPDPTRQDIR